MRKRQFLVQPAGAGGWGCLLEFLLPRQNADIRPKALLTPPGPVRHLGVGGSVLRF